MAVWKAVLLGLIQGLTEFLPVSSSGHLVLIKGVLGLDMQSGGMFFDVMLHLGTLLAIFVAFWNDIWHMIKEGFALLGDCFVNLGRFAQNCTGAGKRYRHVVRSSYRKFVVLIIVSTIPTGILGILLSDVVELANGMMIVPSICLFITALFLFVADRVEDQNKKPREIGYGSAAFVGLTQGLATLPGISRSGTTITACLLCGFDRKFAVKYSFIMSIPAVLGAVLLELKDLSGLSLDPGMIVSCVIATAVAAVSGYLAIRFMLALIRGRKYHYFAIYCILAGCLGLGFSLWSAR